MPIPDVTQLISSVVAEEVENTVKASLLKGNISYKQRRNLRVRFGPTKF